MKKDHSENPLLIEETDKPVLYHYTNATALYSILEKRMLWITRSDFLNDYTESNYFDTILDKTIAEIKTTYPDTKLFLELLEKQYDMEKSLELTQYVLSLTENSDSQHLWSNYSNHDGYNLGFDTVGLNTNYANTGLSGEFIGVEYIIQNGRVIYDTEKQKRIVYSELLQAAKSWENYSKISSVNDYNFGKDFDVMTFCSRLKLYSLFFKHPSFVSEEEYRYVFHPRNKDFEEKLVRFRVSNGVIVPFIELPLKSLMEDGILPLKSITIGPKNKLDTASLGVKTYLMNAKYPDSIRVQKSDIPLRF